MSEPVDWNAKVIAEFRANGGRVGGGFSGVQIMLLHTTGARTGQERVNPVTYREVDGGYAIFATKAGAPTNPDWYHNLVAHPDVRAEIGTRLLSLRARVADDAERDPIWTAQKAQNPGFQDYETRTSRKIPVVILEPAS
jgi:deazaflavin-dependent oxidoreductase (nitroreductase family)